MHLSLHKSSSRAQHSPPAADRSVRDFRGGPSSYALGEQQEQAEVEAQRERNKRVRMRRQTIGFAALVLAAVILLPMIFEPNPVFESVGAQTAIPPVTAAAVSTEVRLDQGAVADSKNSQSVDLNPSTVGPSAPAAANSLVQANPVSPVAANPAPVETMQQEAQTASDAAPQKTDATTVQPTAAAAVNPTQPAKSGKTVWVVQVLASSNKNYAQEKANEVRDAGLPAYVDNIERNGSILWRVRLGPYSSQQEARAQRDKLAFAALPSGALIKETTPN